MLETGGQPAWVCQSIQNPHTNFSKNAFHLICLIPLWFTSWCARLFLGCMQSPAGNKQPGSQPLFAVLAAVPCCCSNGPLFQFPALFYTYSHIPQRTAPNPPVIGSDPDFFFSNPFHPFLSFTHTHTHTHTQRKGCNGSELGSILEMPGQCLRS